MTETPMAIEIDCATGETIERPLTADELTQRAADAAAWAATQQAEADQRSARETARASALAKLAALGLTPDEAAAIFGA